MSTTSQFTSSFWGIYIAVIAVLSFIGLAWLLLSQNVVKHPEKGEEVRTTDHEWNGVPEYNNPLPHWWFRLYVCAWLFGIGYLIIYPGIGDYKGLWGWNSHGQYEEEVAKASQQRGKAHVKFSSMSIEKVAKDPEARAIAQDLFNTYCIQCHGSGAKDSKDFPSLTGDDWLWGGEPEKIQEIIERDRTATMKAWGPELGEGRVKDVAHYVVSLSRSKDQYDEERAACGKVLFNGPPARCSACHGDKGQGIQGVAPNLADNIWLWGGTQEPIIETITNGRHSQMPAWNHFLDKNKLYIIAVYVWSLSNKDGKKAPAKKVKPTPAAQPADASTPAAASAPAADKAASDAKAAPAAEAKPVGKAEAAPVKVDGKAVFEASYKTCYGDMIPGALVVNKKNDRVPQIKRGKDTLHKHAFESFNSMPAKGGNSSLSNDEVKAAVDFTANKSGAKF